MPADKKIILVSIIIPFKDEMAYLEEAVQSALLQGLPDAEIICVCNYSTSIHPPENSSLLNVPSLRWLHEPTPGSAYARNRGLAEAQGTWIQFLDVDDLLCANKISGQLEYADADVVVSPHTYHFLDQKKVSSAWHPDDVWSGLLSGQLGSTSSMLWKKESVDRVGGWNTAYQSSQEYELLFRMLQAGMKISASNQNHTIVRERVSGSITKTTANKPLNGIVLREKMLAFLESKGWRTDDRFEAFRKFVFKNLRALYITDKAMALKLHKKYFSSPPFTPGMGSIPFYNALYQFFGFSHTENIMALYRRVRRKYLKNLPLNQ